MPQDNPFDFPGINVKWGQRAGGGLAGTYPNPTVSSISGLTAGGDLSGTYPNPSLAGTWTNYTPTLTAGTGTFTTASASGRYLRYTTAKLIFVSVSIVITTNGTAGTYITITLPVTSGATSGITFAGREVQSTGHMISGTAGTNTTTMNVQKYDNTYAGADNITIFLSGFYETA